jgi:uncharacterized membrane protein
MLLHPTVVHFPIALWLAATFFDVLGWWRRKSALYRDMALWLVGLGLVGAAASIALGWIDLLDQMRQGVGTGLLLRHRVHSWLAYVATATYLVIFVWRRRTGNRMHGGLLALSLLGAGCIVVTGYLGGDMRQVM